jgi:hypothetical protein
MANVIIISIAATMRSRWRLNSIIISHGETSIIYILAADWQRASAKFSSSAHQHQLCCVISWLLLGEVVKEALRVSPDNMVVSLFPLSLSAACGAIVAYSATHSQHDKGSRKTTSPTNCRMIINSVLSVVRLAFSTMSERDGNRRQSADLLSDELHCIEHPTRFHKMVYVTLFQRAVCVK